MTAEKEAERLYNQIGELIVKHTGKINHRLTVTLCAYVIEYRRIEAASFGSPLERDEHLYQVLEELEKL